MEIRGRLYLERRHEFTDRDRPPGLIIRPGRRGRSRRRIQHLKRLDFPLKPKLRFYKAGGLLAHGFFNIPDGHKQFLFLFIHHGYHITVLRRLPSVDVAVNDNRKFSQFQEHVHGHRDADHYADTDCKSVMDKDVHRDRYTDFYGNSDSPGYE